MIEEELQKLGLSQKEAKVYLAALEMGPRSAQEIARRANINRVTCYLMLEALINRGLVSQVDGEKGRIFMAESPEKMINYFDEQQKEVMKQKINAEKLIPELLALFNVASDKPKVRYLEGFNGIKVLQAMVIESGTKHIDGIVSLDHAFSHFDPRTFDDYRKALLEMKVRGRNIITTKKYTLDYVPQEVYEYQEVRLLPYEKFEFPGEIAIFEKFAGIFSYIGKPICIMVEHPAVVTILQNLFNLAWEGADKFKIDKK